MSLLHLQRKILRRLGCCALLGCALWARAAGEPEITAVVARTSDDYVRTKQSNGTYQLETYAFGEGGVWGGTMHDASIDKLKFLDVARTVARPLAAQNYLPARDPKQTNLLIMVYWGMTTGTGSASGSVAYQNLQASQTMTPPPPPPPQGGSVSTAGADGVGGGGMDSLLVQVGMENRRRDKADAENAGLLGFDAEGVIGTDYGHNIRYTALRGHALDLVEEISENRYFVVLMAYDFQLLLNQKKHKLVWETRFSIRQRGTDFDEQLAAMAQTASRYFGQDSHGVLRKPLPETRVNLGELKIIGIEPEKK